MHKTSNTPTPDTTRSLANFAQSAIAADEQTMQVMQLSLLDWCSVAIAGINEPVSTMVRKIAEQEAGTPEAGVFGSTLRLPARSAALVNGTTSHALDYDDTHFIYLGHPSVAVIPAALAAAEKTAASFAQFTDACLIGVEAACRTGAWMGKSHYKTGFHQTSTSGCIGATLAVSRLFELSEEQTVMALGLAASKASGLRIQFGTMGKPYHAGLAASNAVEAATHASHGFVAASEALETARGFAETHQGECNTHAFEGLGENYVLQSVEHKFHACCHGLHAALEALREIIEQREFSVDAMQKINITINPRFLSVCHIESPTTGLEAKFSYRLTAAMLLNSIDTAQLASYTDDVCSNDAVVKIRDKVHVIASDKMPDTAAEVSVVTSDTTLTAHHDLAIPQDIDTRMRRVRSKSEQLIGPEKSATIWDLITTANAPVSRLILA